MTPFLQKFGELRQRPMERWAPALLERLLRFIIPWRYVVLSICVGVLILAAGVLAGGLVPFVLLQTADAETVTSTWR